MDPRERSAVWEGGASGGDSELGELRPCCGWRRSPVKLKVEWGVKGDGV